MKKTIRYQVDQGMVEKEVNYIPFRYIHAFVISLIEVAMVVGIVVVLCYHMPYFYLAAWCTEIACVIRIVASDDNPEYKIPWLLVVLIVPISGFMLYFLFYSQTLQKKFIKRLDALNQRTYKKEDTTLLTDLEYEDPLAASHAKSYLVDDEIAMIGTINLDYRSLVHHFENGVWMYGTQSVSALKADMEDTLSKCIAIKEDTLKTNLLQRFIRAVVRIVAPML